MGKEQELLKRTPQQIIGDDALTQLIFEGYEVIPARRSSSDEQAEVVGSVDKHAIRVSHTCPGFVADPCGSAKCANCGGRRADHPASPVAMGGVTEESSVRQLTDALKRAAPIVAFHAGVADKGVSSLAALNIHNDLQAALAEAEANNGQ